MVSSNKKWVITFFAVFLAMLTGLGGLTVLIDPYFHYHKPLESLSYILYDERYINDGIVKHFDYDAIITGTSMTQNFKTSELDSLFGVHSVKVPFSGGGYKEINENLERALIANPNIKMILRGLDYGKLCLPADWMRYEEELYPRYLYDNKFYNDVKYIFNKTVLFNETIATLNYTRAGGSTTTFDAYGNWMAGRTFGRDAIIAGISVPQAVADAVLFTEQDREIIRENLSQNVTALANKYPEVEFYLFFTPYSIYHFAQLYWGGQLARQMEIEKYAIELLLQCENVHLFSFFTEFDVITDSNNYKDSEHYGESVNSQMLAWMREGRDKLTLENYDTYCQQESEFYMNYDYNALFAD